MGTNYYLHEKVCDHCGRGDERLHIGKSSGGWCFALHVEPGDPEHPQSLDEWRQRWTKPDARIVDEYGAPLSQEEMLRTITERSWSSKVYFDYESNHAMPGPNGLVRHRIGRYCTGHGEGTWDLVPGEFS